ncbi:MAG: hypothetical protein LCH63_10275 [Candidatus Melainabacteria bacterium]|nr:hypothetical protein [Candidatus Melainabacteria bacterium]
MNLTYTQSKTIRDAGKALDSALALLESVRDSVAALQDDPASQLYCNRKISILVATISNAVSGARDAKRASEDLLGRNLLEVLKEETRKAETAGRLLVSFSLPLKKFESAYHPSTEPIEKVLGIEVIESHRTDDLVYFVAIPPHPQSAEEFLCGLKKFGANITQIKREP